MLTARIWEKNIPLNFECCFLDSFDFTNISSTFRFGLVNAITTDLRLKIHVVWGGIISLNEY